MLNRAAALRCGSQPRSGALDSPKLSPGDSSLSPKARLSMQMSWTLPLQEYISASPCSSGGVIMRRLEGGATERGCCRLAMSAGAAPAVMPRTHHPGRPGSPSAPTTRGCLQWLDEVRMKGGESRPDRAMPPHPEVRSRGPKSPQAERRKATHHRNASRRRLRWCARAEDLPVTADDPMRDQNTCALRRSAPPVFGSMEFQTGDDRRPVA